MARRARTVEGRNRIQNRDWQAGKESNAHSFAAVLQTRAAKVAGGRSESCQFRTKLVLFAAGVTRRGRSQKWQQMAASSPPRGEHADGDLSELLWSLQDM